MPLSVPFYRKVRDIFVQIPVFMPYYILTNEQFRKFDYVDKNYSGR